MVIDVDALANEIRRVDGNHSIGAGALAEALMPFIERALEPQGQALPDEHFLAIRTKLGAEPKHISLGILTDASAIAFGRAVIASQLALPAGPVPEGDALDARRYRKAVTHGVIVLHNGAKACVGKVEADAALDAIAPSPAVAQPVAVIRFERKVPGKENEMPRVVSCNWLPDGEYQVFLSAAGVAQPVADEREAFEDSARSLGVYACHFERFTADEAEHFNAQEEKAGNLRRVSEGDYRSNALRDCWKVWQARAALGQSAEEGGKS